MTMKRMVGCALAAVVAAGGLALTGGTAGADVEGVLVSCADSSSGDIGDAKFAPGITTVESKQTISGSFTASGCTSNDAELDEIAAESKFGVAKTVAGGRPNPIAKATAKFKFTTYGDCLGVALPNDPSDVGEYRPHGTLSLTWLTAGGAKVGTSSVFATLSAGVSATVDGMVTKGLGIGGDFHATAGFLPSASDDTNGDSDPDFLDCAVFADPTAVGKLVDVVTPATLSVELPVTP